MDKNGEVVILGLPMGAVWIEESVVPNVLIVGSLVMVRSTSYAVYVVEDISTTYNSIATMAWTFVIVSMAGILLGAGSIALLMRRSTSPLTALALTARRIAGGEYGIRASVDTHDEVGALADDFNRMAEAMETRIAELMETAERQRLFIGGVTHEFKTPLTALLLHSRMLRRANMTNEEKDASLEHIETQCEWLERLIEKAVTSRDTPFSAPSRYSADEPLTNPQGSLTVNVDAAVIVPNSDGLSTARVEKHLFTEAECQTYIAALFDGQTTYSGDVFETKAYYQQTILDWQRQLALETDEQKRQEIQRWLTEV